MTGAPRVGIRESARAVVRAAQSAGVRGAEALLRLTPAEIEGEFRALHAERRRRLEEADRAAWLIGQYALLAVHAPRRYPRRPDRVAVQPPEMAAGDMLRVLRGLSERMVDRRKDRREDRREDAEHGGD